MHPEAFDTIMTANALSEPNAPTQTPRLRLGRPANSDQNFRALAIMVARDPLYGGVPLNRLLVIDRALASDRLLVATRNGELLGACAWTSIDESAAQAAIAQRRLPGPEQITHAGDAILITMIVASQPGVISKLYRAAVQVHKGHIVIYERHDRRGSEIMKFSWVDRSGVLNGDEL